MLLAEVKRLRATPSVRAPEVDALTPERIKTAFVAFDDIKRPLMNMDRLRYAEFEKCYRRMVVALTATEPQ